MYIPYYNVIKGIIEDGNLGFQEIDWFKDQYSIDYAAAATVDFPSCYIQFLPMEWTEHSQEGGFSEASVIIHVVGFQLDDSPNSIMNLAKSLSNHLSGKSDSNVTPVMGEMTKASTDYSITKGSNGYLIGFKLGFNTVFLDTALDQYTTDVTVNYVLSKQ